jgi:tetratricopeptide (TPR) repeat protein
MATKGVSFIRLKGPWRLLAVGLVLIAVAAAYSLGYNRSPARRAWVHYEAGFKLSCCGEPDPVAVRHFQAALRLNPRLFDARRGLAAIDVNLGKKREAEALYEEAIRLDPTDARPHFELAELALPDDRPQAIRHLKAYLSLYSRDLHGWYELAHCYEKSGQWKEALQSWESAARRFLDDGPAQRGLSRVRWKMQQVAKPAAQP